MIVVGIITAYVGFLLYNAVLTTIQNQIIHTGKREIKLVFIIVLGLVFSIISGIFIGYAKITI